VIQAESMGLNYCGLRIADCGFKNKETALRQDLSTRSSTEAHSKSSGRVAQDKWGKEHSEQFEFGTSKLGTRPKGGSPKENCEFLNPQSEIRNLKSA
jgi:hypothetical protein